MKKLNLFICAFLLFGTDAVKAQYTDLIDFTGTSGTYAGGGPVGALTLSGSVFYGTTSTGGANGDGVIFSYNPVTNIYTDLVDFTGLSTGYSGENPTGGLTLSGGILYGMTTNQGAHGYGVLFSYDPATNVYTDLVDFTGTGGTASGAYPKGSLTLSGGILYGMTSEGGTGYGNIFSFNPVGNVYTSLYSFAHSERPVGSLTLSGGLFYGMTPAGGTGDGNIFSFNPVGNVYTDLLDFTGSSGAAVGKSPDGSLTLAGSLLYGMTNVGGSGGDGVLFSYDPLANVYTDVVNFTNTSGAYLGNGPIGTLTLSGSVLYGMTNIGGIGNGVLFSYNLLTSLYTDLGNFGYSTGDHPQSSITTFGGLLYGMASSGGANNEGVIFSFYDTLNTTGVNSIAASTGVKLYPNPNNGVFTIQSSGGGSQSSVEIYNMVGAKVFTGLLGFAQGDNTINISSQPDGIYLYRVSDENGGLIDQGKIVIEK